MQYRIAPVVLAAVLFAAGPSQAADTPPPAAAKPATGAPKATAPAPASREAAGKSKSKATNGASAAADANAKAAPAKPVPIDVNNASRDELKKLPGIGDAEADRIVKGRPYLTKSHLVTEGVLTETQYMAIRAQIKAVQESGDPTKTIQAKQKQKDAAKK